MPQEISRRTQGAAGRRLTTAGTGPYKNSAVSLVTGGGALLVTILTCQAMSFPFVGFVRTA